ncbi:hypothetical protein ACWN8M_04640 [Pseudolactococcus reticulitermitis]
MEIKHDNDKLVIVAELWSKSRIVRELLDKYNPKRQGHLVKKPTKKN